MPSFFARTFGEQTDSAVPLINLLKLLTFNNVYHLHALSFTHYKNLHQKFFMIFSSTLVLYILIILETPLAKISTNPELEQTPGNRLSWLPSFAI